MPCAVTHEVKPEAHSNSDSDTTGMPDKKVKQNERQMSQNEVVTHRKHHHFDDIFVTSCTKIVILQPSVQLEMPILQK